MNPADALISLPDATGDCPSSQILDTSRRRLDAYETPLWMVSGLLSEVPELRGTMLEPCCGDHAISSALLRARRASLMATNDIDEAKAVDWHMDASGVALYEAVGPVDWIVTNPPFKASLMLPILQRALAHARVGVAILARISFLEPCADRGAWLAARPPQRYLVTERHSFTGNGKSDSATTAWLVWSRRPLSGRPIVALYGYKGAK